MSKQAVREAATICHPLQVDLLTLKVVS